MEQSANLPIAGLLLFALRASVLSTANSSSTYSSEVAAPEPEGAGRTST